MYFCPMFLFIFRKIILSSLLVCSYFLGITPAYSQDTFKPDITLNKLEDSLNVSSSYKNNSYNKKRMKLVAGANIIGYGGALAGLSVIWYSQQPQSGFHFFNDDNEWLQVDKTGHMYSAYLESNASMELWRWAGIGRKKSIWMGGLSGVAYQSVIEILDGFSSEYGFSPGDFAANMLGSAAFISQELAWDEQRIKIKFSCHKNNYHAQDLDARADQLYGKTLIERFIKDYNAQSYWLSANIHSFFPGSTLPRWLNVSAGYGANGMFGGTTNLALDKTGNVIFDRRDIKRYRQWYLSPDIDFTKIKTNKKGVKILLFVLNSFKFPAPALEYSNGTFKGHWLLF